MNKYTIEFLDKMLEFFPETNNKFQEEVDYYGEILETIIIENVFMPKIIELINKNENTKLLCEIFKYFEEASNCKDMDFINVFSVTVLEILGNDRTILKTAQGYMGPKMKLLQIKADRALGRRM